MSRCRCPHHVEDFAGISVPFCADVGGEGAPTVPVTVGNLLEWEAIDAERDGATPDRWLLWFGDETRAHYDDDAPLSLEGAVTALEGLTDVVGEDRETIMVTAVGRCRDGMLAMAARALLDDRVRCG